MPMTFDVDTRDLEPVGPAATRLSPPVDLVRKRSPFYVSQLPSLSSVSYDQIRNFETPQIPQQRITPAPPLTLSSAAINATPIVATAPILIQTTPAPTIAAPLATVPTGFTFSFFQVRLPVSSRATINNYKVYRSTANNSATASVIQTISHKPSQCGPAGGGPGRPAERRHDVLLGFGDQHFRPGIVSDPGAERVGDQQCGLQFQFTDCIELS